MNLLNSVATALLLLVLRLGRTTLRWRRWMGIKQQGKPRSFVPEDPGPVARESGSTLSSEAFATK